MYIEIFSAVKIEKISEKNIGILNVLAQNIGCWCMLERPWEGGSNEYLQSMEAKLYTFVHPIFHGW